MTPEISEFSYGFALTNEIVGWNEVSTAPIFPSLIEEGRSGGGYDVRLDMPGVLLFLQFKRADCMVRATAKEIQHFDLPLSIPFYRFKITETGKSRQHELLLELDDGVNLVYYAAPRFHELSEINSAWSTNQIASRSIFVTPNDIGILNEESHHVAYDDINAYLCSEPKPLGFYSSSNLIEKLGNNLIADPQPLGSKLPALHERVERARRNVEKRILDRQTASLKKEGPLELVFQTEERSIRRQIEPVSTRQAKPLSGPNKVLRDIADTASKVFDTQLLVVQKKRDGNLI